MEQNKIYNQCREEAFKIICEENKTMHPVIVHVLNKEKLKQLTAELYAQKFADWIQPMDSSKDYILRSQLGWYAYHTRTVQVTNIGTTAQLHEKFVEENKGGENGNS